MKLDIEAGARNLLLNCAGARAGDRLLLVGELGKAAFFDPALCDDVAAAASSYDIETEILLAEPGADASHFPAAVAHAMQTSDITIFFSRLGDQLRFVESPGPGKKIMAYALSREHLGSPFSTVDYSCMKAMHDRLLQEIKKADSYVIEAENGTCLSAEILDQSVSAEPVVNDFTLELFPVMIYPPVNFFRLNGRLVLEHFLLSSSTRTYAESELRLDSPVSAVIEDARMVDFEGDAALIAKIRDQLERAAALTGGDAYRLNSWHTGINPYTFYDADPQLDLERWGTVAYGSPRYTHIHAAGKDPGDVSFQLFDASIRFDGRPFWDGGRFLFLDDAEVQSLFDAAHHQAPDSSTRLSIGI